jgi:hypothetical protein
LLLFFLGTSDSDFSKAGGGGERDTSGSDPRLVDDLCPKAELVKVYTSELN